MDKKIYFLIFIALFSVGIYLFGFMGEFSNYALKNRSLQIASIVIVGICIAVSSIVFQTISNNKILTPSIIGLDSLYMLLQSCLVFILGSTNLIVYKENIDFLLSLFCMVIFSLLLYKLLFKNERNIYLIMLLGIIFG
ncbi:iron chelate uptake ABC transporter family permease subunit, partial [Campylobacter novaezeelandiae]|uniref:iron chelate uptake ABC transporter family permease subunit n=1 Tax=Campylobacter novaezeelandiae TaxID=2267891 RepID=UPI001903CB1E